MSVTIKELVAVVATAGNVSKKIAERQVVALFSATAQAVKSGQQVVIRDFGRIYPKVKPARQARNPKTGAAVQVLEKTVVKFAPRGQMK